MSNYEDDESYAPEDNAPDDNEEVTLPALISTELNDLPQITDKSTFRDVKEADLIAVDNTLRALQSGWGLVRSVSSLCKMSLTTMEVLKRRRELLCMNYGTPNKNSQISDIEVLD